MLPSAFGNFIGVSGVLQWSHNGIGGPASIARKCSDMQHMVLRGFWLRLLRRAEPIQTPYGSMLMSEITVHRGRGFTAWLNHASLVST